MTYWSPVIVQTEHKDMYYVIAELSPDLDLDPDPDPDPDPDQNQDQDQNWAEVCPIMGVLFVPLFVYLFVCSFIRLWVVTFCSDLITAN